MPYKDKEQQREYQRLWRQRRREEWFKDNGPCCVCGSWDELEIDHKDRAEKVTHRIWSWSEKKRKEELEKCQVLCKKCHLKKTIKEATPPHGTHSRYTHKKKPCRCTLCREAHRLTALAYKKHGTTKGRSTLKNEDVSDPSS